MLRCLQWSDADCVGVDADLGGDSSLQRRVRSEVRGPRFELGEVAEPLLLWCHYCCHAFQRYLNTRDFLPTVQGGK